MTGVGDDFNRFIRFDETDLLANTNELEYSLTNRLFAKRGDNVTEIFTWELSQKRYFDPTFGGALIPGQPNVFTATADLSAYPFLLGPRNYSPVVSMFRASPVAGLGINWQADYDPFYHKVVDSSFSIDYRFKKYLRGFRRQQRGAYRSAADAAGQSISLAGGLGRSPASRLERGYRLGLRRTARACWST